jgi:hypothetical protein
MTRAQAAAMEGRVAVLQLLLVWQYTFLHLGKFGDLLREENGQYTYGYFITFLTLCILRLISYIICSRFLMNAFNILIEFLIVTFLVVYWLAC